MKDVDTYTSLIASTKQRIDEEMAELAEYAEKLRRAAYYLSH